MVNTTLVAAINWNGKNFIADMIDSLLPQLEETNTKLLVFDNGSEDGSVELVEKLYGESELVTVYKNKTNIGFGKAANRILKETVCSTVVLVNTDTILKKGCLRNLLQAFHSKADVAFAGPKLLWPDGSLQPSKRGFPFPRVLVKEHIPLLKHKSKRFSKHDKGTYTDWLVGAMMAVRVKAFNEVGGFSSEFSFFHEETDLQFRLKKAGWKVWFEPSAEVYHLEGASSRQRYGSKVFLGNIPGKILFLRKHGTPLDVLLFKYLMTILQIHRYIIGIFSKQLLIDDIRFTKNYCTEAIHIIWDGKEKNIDKSI